MRTSKVVRFCVVCIALFQGTSSLAGGVVANAIYHEEVAGEAPAPSQPSGAPNLIDLQGIQLKPLKGDPSTIRQSVTPAQIETLTKFVESQDFEPAPEGVLETEGPAAPEHPGHGKPRKGLFKRLKNWLSKMGGGFPIFVPSYNGPSLGGGNASEPEAEEDPSSRMAKEFARYIQDLRKKMQERNEVRAAVSTTLQKAEKVQWSPSREGHRGIASVNEVAPAKGRSATRVFRRPLQVAAKKQAASAATQGETVLANQFNAGKPAEAARAEESASAPVSQGGIVYSPIPVLPAKALVAETAAAAEKIALAGDLGDLAEGEDETPSESESSADYEAADTEESEPTPSQSQVVQASVAGPLRDPALWALGLIGGIGWAATASPKRRSRAARQSEKRAPKIFEPSEPGEAVPLNFARKTAKRRRAPMGVPRLNVSHSLYRATLAAAWTATFGFAFYLLNLMRRRDEGAFEPGPTSGEDRR